MDLTKFPNWSLIISFVINILFILFIIFFIFFRFSSKKKYRNNKSNNEIYEPFYKMNHDNQMGKIEDLKKENESLKRRIKSLENKTVTTNYKPSEITNDVSSQKEKVIEDKLSPSIELTIPIKKPKTKTIFLPSPFKENRFSIEDESEIQLPTSIYKVDYDLEERKGAIQLLATADLTRALNSPHTFLETVCIYQNAYNSKANGISVVEKGSVILEDKDWVVTNKIKIKFI